jgi:hypothetical protein
MLRFCGTSEAIASTAEVCGEWVNLRARSVELFRFFGVACEDFLQVYTVPDNEVPNAGPLGLTELELPPCVSHPASVHCGEAAPERVRQGSEILRTVGQKLPGRHQIASPSST